MGFNFRIYPDKVAVIYILKMYIAVLVCSIGYSCGNKENILHISKEGMSCISRP